MPHKDPIKRSEYNKKYLEKYLFKKPYYYRIKQQKYRDKLRIQVIEAYGEKCKHCGINDPIVLCLDHINNDGHKVRSGKNRDGNGRTRIPGNGSSGTSLYRKLKKLGWPKDNYQLLCHNCNFKKEYYRRRSLRKDKHSPKDIT